MRTVHMFAVTLFFLAGAAARPQDAGAQAKASCSQAERYQHSDFQKIRKNYLRCLNSDSPQVVESALGHVTYVRIAFPDKDLSELQNKIADLALHGATREIRFRAFTALEVFANPSQYAGYIATRDGNGDGLLSEIGVRFQQQAQLTGH